MRSQDVAGGRAGAARRRRGHSDIGLSVVGYSFGAATGMLFGHARRAACRGWWPSPRRWARSLSTFLADCRKPSLHMVGKKDFLYSRREGWRVSPIRRTGGAGDGPGRGGPFLPRRRGLLARQVEEFLRGLRAQKRKSA